MTTDARTPDTDATALRQVFEQLRDRTHGLRFGPPVTHVYRPLEYAFQPFAQYLQRFARPGVRAVLLGMNPGPFGMVQTGVPFGEVAAVRDWMGICAPVQPPDAQHPKRPVRGFDCPRSEISGQRLWGWACRRFGEPQRFFRKFFVLNYCPLAFVEESSANRTPDKLPAAERLPLFQACDEAVRRAMEVLRPQWVIGVGDFAAKRARIALEGLPLQFGRIPHPSPASPAANRGWDQLVEAQLAALNLLPALSAESKDRRTAVAAQRSNA